jgi:NhaC family Na+:H+ antiporter
MAMESENEKSKRPIRAPSLLDALIPIFFLIALIAGALALYGEAALGGPLPAALVLCTMVASLIVLKNGHPWEALEASAQRSLSSVTTAVFILLGVGALIGTWNLSGTIPTLVSYGMRVLSPQWFYPSAAVICGVVALSIGSSWTTAGTIGVGLIGIASLLGLSPAITAGAVISGAYLGDKCSPLSETTVLTAQMVKVSVYDHIKRQIWTSVPAFIIAAIVFTVIAASSSLSPEAGDTATELDAIGDVFNISPWTLLPFFLLVVLAVRKTPPFLALMASSLFAGILALFLQPAVVAKYMSATDSSSGLQAVWSAIATGFTIDSGFPEIDQLVSRGGMSSMLTTLWLIIGAVTFGTILEEFGLIGRILDPIVARAKTVGKLYLTVFASAFGLNLIAGDQYIALVLPARIYRAEFAQRGLAPTNLSRLAADCGTVTSPLVPWNSCGAYLAAVLGVSTLHYLPYAVFCYASPILSVLYGITGFKIEKITPGRSVDSSRSDRDRSYPSGHGEVNPVG